jgi:hypothetical protein
MNSQEKISLLKETPIYFLSHRNNIIVGNVWKYLQRYILDNE